MQLPTPMWNIVYWSFYNLYFHKSVQSCMHDFDFIIDKKIHDYINRAVEMFKSRLKILEN